MSIRDLIRECVDAGDLVILRPILPGTPRMREVFVTPHVHQLLSVSSNVPVELRKKAADCRVALDRFVAGAVVTVGLDPFNKKAACELARTEPPSDGVWCFRIRDPKPHVRIFGGFAERDVFVAVDYRNREALDFDAAGLTARLLWDDLFKPFPPLIGHKIDDYLSSGYSAG